MVTCVYAFSYPWRTRKRSGIYVFRQKKEGNKRNIGKKLLTRRHPEGFPKPK